MYVDLEVLGVELDYLPCVQMSCFNWVWTPYPNRGCGVDFPLHYSCRGVQGGRQLMSEPPLVGVQGKCPRKEFFMKNAL